MSTERVSDIAMVHVLLVEPDKQLATMYARGLRAAGFAVAVAHTAQQAIHAADDQCPDVVVLELQMAAHNGVEFLYEFRSYAEWQAVPVLICTVVPEDVAQIDAASRQLLGIAGYLYKPTCSLAKLEQTIRQLPDAGDMTAPAQDVGRRISELDELAIVSGEV